MIQRYCDARKIFIDVEECYGCPNNPDECNELEACKGKVKIDTIERIKQLESENAALKTRKSLCPVCLRKGTECRGFVEPVIDCPSFLPDGPVVPVEKGAIEELINIVSESNTDENNIKMVAIDKEFINQARAELASLRRPVDRDALATLLKKFGHGSWRSSAEWITIDTPIETILDAIMELIGRSK